MLEHQIELDETTGIVICTARGTLNVKSAQMISVANVTAYELGYSVIYDLSQTRLSATIVEAYQFPRNRAALFGEPNRIPKSIAIVYPDSQRLEFWSFYETTSRNSGLNLKVFDSLSRARNWCTSPADD